MIELSKSQKNELFKTVFDKMNTNWEIIENSINEISNVVDVTGKTISNIENISLVKGKDGTKTTDILLTTNGAASFGTNIMVGETTKTKNLEITNNITVLNGTLTSTATSAVNRFAGGLNVESQFILGSASRSGMIMEFNNLTRHTTLVGSGFPAGLNVGKIDVSSRSFAELNFSGRTNANTSTFLNRVRLETSNIQQGHRLTITAILPTTPVGSDTYQLVNGRTAINQPKSIENLNDNQAVQFNQTYNVAEFIFRGTNWRLIGLYGATIVTVS